MADLVTRKVHNSTSFIVQWLNIMVLLVLNLLTHDDHSYCVEVNGAVVNVRSKGDKLAVWVTDSANNEAVVSPDALSLITLFIL